MENKIVIDVKGISGLAKCERLIDDGYKIVSMVGTKATLILK